MTLKCEIYPQFIDVMNLTENKLVGCKVHYKSSRSRHLSVPCMLTIYGTWAWASVMQTFNLIRHCSDPTEDISL